MSKPCSKCRLIYPKYFYQNNNCYCIFCKIVNFPTSSDIYSYRWGFSNYTQLEIIESYRKNYLVEYKIVHPTVIDPNVKILNANPYIVSQLKLPDDLSTLKVFFTHSLDKSYLHSPNIFTQFTPTAQNQNNINWDLSSHTVSNNSVDTLIQIYLSTINPTDFF